MPTDEVKTDQKDTVPIVEAVDGGGVHHSDQDDEAGDDADDEDVEDDDDDLEVIETISILLLGNF